MELIVGIDLGTTNSEISILEKGEPKVIPIGNELLLPSCVGINPEGKLVVGQVAKNQAVSEPESTILSIKRQMGTAHKVSLGGKQFSPEEISSFILIELKKYAEEYLQQKVRKAVITVPAYFDDTQRKATKDAGELAGLEVVRIINEPTAAAIAYTANSEINQKILVYDLGGGTFDVSLVVVENGVVEVKASHGDTKLGGDDFDQLLVEEVVKKFKETHGVDLSNDFRTQRRLKVSLEKAKRVLSDHPLARVQEEYLYQDHHIDLEITRERYEELISPLLQKTLECVQKCLEDASLLPKDIDKIILVGGSTRTPYIHELLQREMKITPHYEINPDLIVSMGAAIQGGIIAGIPTNAILVDITPYTFGTKAVVSYEDMIFEPDSFVPIIKRNTPLPVSKSEMFLTLHDEQSSVKVEIFQGESEYTSKNIFVGEFLIEGLSKVPAGNKILLHLQLDLNGILTVTATEKETKLSKVVKMEIGGVAKTQLNLEEARENIASLLVEEEEIILEKEIEGDEILNTAKNLRKRAEKLLESVSAEDAQEIQNLLQKSHQAVREKNLKELLEINTSLEDLVFYLED